MRNFERGSEWRRWDLHIHTPGTIKNDQFQGSTIEEKWENFYNSITNYIGDGSDPLKAIKVIGITDYVSIKNYQRVLNDKRLPESVCLILPNVELRIKPYAKNAPVNIHCIFDPSIAKDAKVLEDRFFNNLKFDNGNSVYNASEEGLKRLGRDYLRDKNIPDNAAYVAGINQFVLEFSALKQVFDNDKDLRDHCIVVVANSSGDGVSGIVQHSQFLISNNNESQMDETRRSIYRFADMVFSSSASDISYFLGESKSDDQSRVKELYGSLKPCIHGSDAHSCNTLFEPNEQRYCWIKADPTFNGLRQVLYEPKDRVKISPLKPEQKKDYQVIDKVEICNNKDFSPVPIYFNDKLTCIIGGKSTGKSLLLNNMANAIDSEQVGDKTGITSNRGKVIKDVKVYWRDGEVSQNGDSSQEHRVVYIPQTYLNRLSDNDEELTEIDSIIHDIVMINDGAQRAFKDMEGRITDLKTSIDKAIYSIIQQYKNWKDQTQELAEIGTFQGINKEIEKLEFEKDRLSKQLSLSEDEVTTYAEIEKEILTLEQQIASSKRNIESIKSIRTLVTVSSEEYELVLPSELLIKIKESGEKAVKAADDIWHSDQIELLNELEGKLADFQKCLDEKRVIAAPLKAKISENEAIKRLTDDLNREKAKLEDYTEAKKQVENSKTKYDDLLESLAESFLKYQQLHKSYADFINGNSSLLKKESANDLEFTVGTPFRKDAFLQTIQSSFDRRTSFKSIIDVDSFTEKEISKEFLVRLIASVIDGTIHLPRSKTPESVLRELLRDWYNSTYRVRMGGDLINEMSPGKKALVLLKLLVSLAESTFPILIDQPEDDLDNRSIFSELIPFLRKAKITRQVIVVTHNANVVLGADADEIIVANQDGKNSPNKAYRFEYRSGSIEDDMPEGSGCSDTLGKQGIQQQICDILEGGQLAFDLRKHKYRI